ncbi:hypothetical protein A0J48_000675 [Sphaerospermopsis aphanizomenoides BCCUSP55]|uniref:hypothetical protein n=1 Tax=Sphaerospermopsis aphanizomenoides TaxID=459663 RepID=UPI00190359C3|nr:hypothetical protein [Sphaerospermopsis aphanizomenoides]MBK1986079.1 hypothetical protein [Sphaerospermopsis aphanizomenoides BCCUSP55]
MKELPYIVPSSQPETQEIFAVHQTTVEFYHEVETRSEFKRYCEWYYKTADQNRRELEKMRGEINIMGWFLRR